jgi:phosphoribosylamine---glycine ligase
LGHLCKNGKKAMNILIIGSGGREHALAKALKSSENCGQLFIAPGNAGTSQFGTNALLVINDFEAMHQYCTQNKITLIVVGPEDPLVNGIVDYFLNTTINIVGPDKYSAQLEGSKAFAKAFMAQHNIPTASYAQFNKENYEAGVAYLQQQTLPIVLKADGLAAGKGVVICDSHAHALEVFSDMIIKEQFGAASSTVVVEQFLDGIECSVFALTDGENYILLPEAKDYKRIGVGDTGLNTGGMGAISPVPFYNGAFEQKVIDKIINPTINGFLKNNMHYKGFVFFGLIKVGNEPFVIEYNCRLGDPETETILPRLQSDLLAHLSSLFNGTLAQQKVQISNQAAATIMAVSAGYPQDYEKGAPITFNAVNSNSNFVYHAGTATKNNEIITNGGRVLCATSLAPTITEAVHNAGTTLKQVHFNGMYFRPDIGYEFL